MAGLLAEYDYVIAGGGSAGCVLARRLAEDPDTKVLLVEAGPHDRGLHAIHDAANWVPLMSGAYDWGYSYAPTPHVAGRSIPIPRGRVLGGSSSINAMMWNRGHPTDYDAWEAAGATGWNYASLLPCFRRAEDWQLGATELRGVGGPLRIERSADPHPIALAMLQGAQELGLPVQEDLNGPSNLGAALSNFNMCGAERWSAARGYLWPAADWPNLTVITGSLAIGLEFEGTRCIGLRHLVGGTQHLTRAAREVLLTLGAFDTPRLLWMSGIGDPADLARLGVQVRAALPGLGRNFQDHPLLMGMNFRARRPLGPVRDNGGGSMMNWASRAGLPGPDLHAFIVQGPHAGPEIAERYDISGDVFAMSPGLMRCKSVGHISLHAATPGAPMELQPNFLAEPEDLEALVRGVDFILELAATPAFRDLVDRPAAPEGRLSHAEAIEFVRLSCSTFYHCCGTAKMGTDEAAVVTPDLRVRGLDGLRVADASVIPVMPSCNTHAPVIALAERAADLIRGLA